jgi:hypothetical protein
MSAETHSSKEVAMKSNESTADRIIRIFLAVGLGVVVALKIVTGTAAVVVGAAAGILFLTGVISFCGIYALLGISTCRLPDKC